MMFRTEHLSEGVTLYCGDCREILPTLGRVDAVVTDPPYGIGYVTNHRKIMFTPEMLKNDETAPIWSVSLMADRLFDGGAMYICTRDDVAQQWRDAIIAAGLQPKTTIVWDKLNWTAGDLDGDYGAQTELILFSHKGRHTLRNGRDHNLWRIPRDPPSDHPTPKPVAVMARAIRNSSDMQQTVLDPFMGSGTTGVAAVKLGRRFIGIEIEPKYFDISCRRISEALKQPDMFIERPAHAKQEALI